uniref:Putative LOC100214709 [Hydra vulgaris] n=1 Tax=Lepeophtheirus salmonis TaxID=72036 RepID=A0A0K2V8G5_LEPSM
MNVGFSSSSVDYLSLRRKLLSPNLKKVILMVNEVYTAQRVEYFGGRMIGQEGGSIKKTLFVFMIKLVCSKYQERVAMYPIICLNSSVLHDLLLQINTKLFKIGFDVVTISMDNASPNRKCFLAMCVGSWKASVPNPARPE